MSVERWYFMDDHFHQLGRPQVRVTIRVGDEVVARSERTLLLKEFAREMRKISPGDISSLSSIHDTLQAAWPSTHGG